MASLTGQVSASVGIGDRSALLRRQQEGLVISLLHGDAEVLVLKLMPSPLGPTPCRAGRRKGCCCPRAEPRAQRLHGREPTPAARPARTAEARGRMAERAVRTAGRRPIVARPWACTVAQLRVPEASTEAGRDSGAAVRGWCESAAEPTLSGRRVEFTPDEAHAPDAYLAAEPCLSLERAGCPTCNP